MQPDSLLDNLRRSQDHLLARRDAQGRWEGRLSSSALSTAIAVCTLKAFLASAPRTADTERLIPLCVRGLQWLVDHQNADGGWGDTTLSFSNISTTALCWAAFAGDDRQYEATVAACTRWLARQIEQTGDHAPTATDSGRLYPKRLAAAVVRRYGKDHTFSVPILTTLALTGRLGADAREAWALVPQLPFELAAFPRAWYASLGLPVVSYALPALIAIGQLRHHLAPTWNLPLRFLRNLTIQPTLKVLEQIQPTTGGYLEATPLTSFVCLSLIGAGRAGHNVVQHGLRFLLASVREDGSWAIDSNLATWVTTLSINGLEAGDALQQLLSAEERRDLRNALIERQYTQIHPFTNAAPGGWAWTDLSGGVPDADDTSGALLALHALDDGGDRVRSAVEAGVGWLLDLQNKDGGIPTFCRGWGTLPFDRSSADITAHAVRAWLCWEDRVPPAVRHRVSRAVNRSMKYLITTQQSDGSWNPLWFGNQHLADEVNPVYGTSRVLLAFAARAHHASLGERERNSSRRGLHWLIRCQNSDGGWGGGSDTPSSIEETALAVEALAVIAASPLPRDASAEARCDLDAAIERGVDWLSEHTDGGTHFPCTPIGFYFAKLWYFEELYPAIFTTAALGWAARRLQPQQSVAGATPGGMP